MLEKNEAYGIYPVKTRPMEAMDHVQTFISMALINGAVSVVAVLILFAAGSTGHLLWGCAVWASIGIWCCVQFCLQASKEKTKVTDIEQSFVSLENYELACRQAVENGTYEECRIDYLEIENILPREKQQGIYIWLKDEREGSVIRVDDNVVDRKLFYIDGKMYEADDFRGVYENLLQRIKIKNVPTEAVKWKEEKGREKIRKIMSAWVLGISVLVLQIMCSVLF